MNMLSATVFIREIRGQHFSEQDKYFVILTVIYPWAVGATLVAQRLLIVRLKSHLQSSQKPYFTLIRDEP